MIMKYISRASSGLVREVINMTVYSTDIETLQGEINYRVNKLGQLKAAGADNTPEYAAHKKELAVLWHVLSTERGKDAFLPELTQ